MDEGHKQSGHGSIWTRLELLLDELDLTPKVTVAKELRVDNPRLVILNCSLVLSAFVFLAVYFYYRRPHMIELPYTTSTTVYFDEKSLLEALGQTRSQDPDLCNSNPNSKCIQVCSNSLQSDCAPFDHSYEQMTPEHLFIPVAIRHFNLSQVGTPKPTMARLMYYARKFKFVLHHASTTMGAPATPFGEMTYKSSSSHNAATVVVNARGGVWKIFQPGAHMTLGFTDLLDLAEGIPAGMTFDQFFNHAADKGGMVTTHADCFNQVSDASQEFPGLEAIALKDMKFDHLCLLKLKWDPLPPMASSRLSMSLTSPSMATARTGIFFQSRPGSGYGRYNDVGQLVISLTTTAVVFTLPSRIMRVFLIIGLGQLSRIYRRGIRERFNLEERSQEVCTELLSHHKSFQLLCHDAGSEEGHVTLASVQAHFREILEEDQICNISKTDINRMIAYSYFPLMKRKDSHAPRVPEGSVKQEIIASFMGIHSFMDFSGWREKQLDPSAFMHSVSGGGRVLDFWDLCTLFRSSRKLTCLERVFTPTALHQIAHKFGDNDDDDEGGLPSEVPSRSIQVDNDVKRSQLSRFSSGRQEGPSYHTQDETLPTTTSGGEVLPQSTDEGPDLALAFDEEHRRELENGLFGHQQRYINFCTGIVQMIHQLEARLESVEQLAKASSDEGSDLRWHVAADAKQDEASASCSNCDSKLAEQSRVEHMSPIATEMLASLLAKYESVLLDLEVQVRRQLEAIGDRLLEKQTKKQLLQTQRHEAQHNDVESAQNVQNGKVLVTKQFDVTGDRLDQQLSQTQRHEVQHNDVESAQNVQNGKVLVRKQFDVTGDRLDQQLSQTQMQVRRQLEAIGDRLLEKQKKKQFSQTQGHEAQRNDVKSVQNVQNDEAQDGAQRNGETSAVPNSESSGRQGSGWSSDVFEPSPRTFLERESARPRT